MNKTRIVNWANAIGIIAVVCLIYWVFIFMVNTVFGLKIFKAHLTEAFFMSVLGLLALMAGTLMVSLMLNITRIAASLEKLTSSLTNTSLTSSLMSARQKLLLLGGIVLSFVLIAVGMFAGDAYTRYEKKRLLLNMATTLVEENKNTLQATNSFVFSRPAVVELGRQLEMIAKIDSTVDELSLLVQDNIDGRPVVLSFNRNASWRAVHDDNKEGQELRKINYLFSASQAQRVYLNEVFAGKTTESRFEANNGNYELFYPVVINKKVVVFYFNDYQRYGKFSS